MIKDIDDKNEMWLERAFYRKFNTANVKYQRVALYPDFSGQSGSTGIDYKVSRQVLIGKNSCIDTGILLSTKNTIMAKETIFIWEEAKRH